MKNKEKGAHEWMIEFKKAPESLKDFCIYLDSALQQINSDYEAKRYKNMTLDIPKIHQSRKNLFYDWLKSEKKLGGQHKVPRLSNHRNFMETLLKLNEKSSQES